MQCECSVRLTQLWFIPINAGPTQSCFIPINACPFTALMQQVPGLTLACFNHVQLPQANQAFAP